MLILYDIGKQEAAEVSVEALKAVPEPFSSFATVLLEICAYAGMVIMRGVANYTVVIGTGNVLKIQSLLHICSEYFGEDDKEGEEKEREEKKKEKTKEGTMTSASEPGATNSLRKEQEQER